MPTSYLDNIPTVMRLAIDMAPESILDVGVGCGKYGLLCREYIQTLKKLDGVEIYAPYITGIQLAIYDTVFIADVRSLPLEKMNYDLVLMVDVLEHFEKEEGLRLLERISGNIIVSTPKAFFDFDNETINPHERHKSLWTLDDFRGLNRAFSNHSNERSIIVLLLKR